MLPQFSKKWLIVIIASVITLISGFFAVQFLLSKMAKPANADFKKTILHLAPKNTLFISWFELSEIFNKDEQQKLIDALFETYSFYTTNLKDESKVKFLIQNMSRWLTGSAAVIIIPQTEEDSKLQFQGVAALGITAEGNALGFLVDLEKLDSTHFSSQKYHQAKIITYKKGEHTHFLSMTKGLLLLGLKETDIKWAIDRLKNSENLQNDTSDLEHSPQYQEAWESLKYKDIGFTYINLQRLGSQLLSDPKMMLASADFQGLVQETPYGVRGLGKEGSQMISEGHIKHINIGTLGQKLFNPSYNIAPSSLRFANAEKTASVTVGQISWLWDLAYEVAGVFPQGEIMRDFPAEKLSQYKIDLQKDIWDNLTGELAYISQLKGEDFTSNFIAGIKDEKKFSTVFTKITPPGFFTHSLDNKTPMWISKNNKQAYTVLDHQFIFSINGSQALQDLIKNENNPLSLPGYQKLQELNHGQNKFVFFSYINMKLKALKWEKLLNNSRNLGLLKILHVFSDKFSTLWGETHLGPDGLDGFSVLDLK